MNNVLEVESHHQMEEVKEEAPAYVKIAAAISNNQDDTMKEERRSQLSQASRAISKVTDCPRCGKHFSRKDNLQRHMRKVNCHSTKGSQRGGGGAVSEGISIKDDTLSAVT